MMFADSFSCRYEVLTTTGAAHGVTWSPERAANAKLPRMGKRRNRSAARLAARVSIATAIEPRRRHHGAA